MKPAVTESALDGVLERLLLADRDAAALFLRSALPEQSDVAFDRVTVVRQVRHLGASGTADLVARFWAGPSCVALLLVENKIDAGFTPDQPARYAVGRDAHRAANSAAAVATLLVAPDIYLAGSRLAAGFDGVLSYGRLLPIVAGQDRELVETAVERAESPYEPVPVAAVMDFFTGYAELVRQAAPDLVLKRNPNSGDARPEASRTIYFDAKRSGFASYPFLLKEGRPASLRLSHQCWDSGAPSPSVKAMVDGWARHLPLASPVLSAALRDSGIYVRPAGRSLALVLDTSRLDNMRAVAGQETIILDALSKLQRLRDAWNGLREPLRELSALVANKEA
jgi:hypothetical protein